jgi:hypothetical protein
MGWTMPILTFDAIKENPCNILTHELPKRPTRLLLILAELAATLCRQMQEEIIDDLERVYGHGDITFARREGTAALKKWFEAYRKQGEVGDLLEERFDLPMLKFSLERYVK